MSILPETLLTQSLRIYRIAKSAYFTLEKKGTYLKKLSYVREKTRAQLEEIHALSTPFILADSVRLNLARYLNREAMRSVKDEMR